MKHSDKIELLIDNLKFLNQAAINYLLVGSIKPPKADGMIERFIVNANLFIQELAFQLLAIENIRILCNKYIEKPDKLILDSIHTMMLNELDSTKYPSKTATSLAVSIKNIYHLSTTKSFHSLLKDINHIIGLDKHEYVLKEDDIKLYRQWLFKYPKDYQFLINKTPQQLINIL